MPFRRAAAILATILLVPQFLWGAEIGCPSHGDDHNSVAASAPMEGHEHHQQGSDRDTVPTETHPASDCCPAMSSCWSGGPLQAADNGLTGPALHNGAPSGVETLLRSRVETPDPPPPKA